MRQLVGSIGFGLVVALMILSPFLLVIGVVFVIGLVVAALVDLFSAVRGDSKRNQSPFRGYRD